jgi:DNA polymerase-3 subunit epsilon
MPTFRQSTILKAQELWFTQPVFIDTETTGLSTNAEIVEICIIDHDSSLLFESLIRPRRLIPADVIRVHGITNEMVHDAPTWLQVWPEVEAVLRSRSVGIYNAEFDLRMFQQSHLANGLPLRLPPSRIFCIMKLFSDYSGAFKWLKLEEARAQCHIPIPNSHRARDDAMLAREVFLHIVNSKS